MAAFNLKDDYRGAWEFQGAEGGANFQDIDPAYTDFIDDTYNAGGVLDSVGPAAMFDGRYPNGGQRTQALGLNIQIPFNTYVLQIWETENNVATLKAIVSSDSPNATEKGRIRKGYPERTDDGSGFGGLRDTFLYWGQLVPFDQLKEGDVWILYSWAGNTPPYPVAYPPDRAVLLD